MSVTQQTQAPPAFEGWAVLEIMGHRRLAGRVAEVDLFGAKMARIDIYAAEGDTPLLTQMYGGSSIFSLTPATEAVCRKMGQQAKEQQEREAKWEAMQTQRSLPVESTREEEDEEEDDYYDGTSDDFGFR